MKVKIFSTADWHSVNQDDFWKSANHFYEKAKEERPDLIAIAADIWDRAVYNSKSSGFDLVTDFVRDLLDIAPIVTVYGTPTHDIPGSLDVFEKMKARHSFTILRPGVPYFLGTDNRVSEGYGSAKLLLLGIPEPNKNWILANNENLGSGGATEAVINGMNRLLLGLATQRKQHADLPCLVVYHGEIAGASISNTQVLPAGGITLGAKDLAMINADYYSCGHIHMRQEIPGITGGYEGSIYNKTWGELDRKAFSIVEIEKADQGDLFSEATGKAFSLDRKEEFFPAVPMKKIITTWPALPKDTEIESYKVWLKIMIEKGKRSQIDQEAVLKGVIAAGGDKDSRVTVEVIPEETTRAAEIVEQKTLFDKVNVWAKNTGIKLPEGVAEKCIELEKELAERGLTHSQRSLRLDRVDIRGAIGIWKGLKQEEISVDFQSINPGTIALIGDNGCGKSTLIKNCNPFSRPIDGLDGKDTFQNHFYLRDSHSITYWTDTISEIRYKAVKLIDGKNKSGKTEFFLYKSDGLNWVPYNEEQTGRQEGYNSAVLEVFGSADMFIKSVYTSQSGASLPSGNKEKKEFFNELLGNSYLEDVATSCRERASVIEKANLKATGQLQAGEESLERLPELEQKLDELKEAEKGAVVILKTAEAEVFKKQDEVKKLREEHLENERLREQIGILARSVSDNEFKIKELAREIDSLKDTQKQVPEAERIVNEYDALSEKKRILVEKRNRKAAEFNSLQEKYNAEKKRINDLVDEKERAVRKLEDQIGREKEVSRNAAREIAEIYDYCQSIKKPCENCGHIQSDIQKIIDQKKDESEDLTKKSQDSQITVKNLTAELEAAKAKIVNKETLEKLQAEINTIVPDLEVLQKQIDDIDLRTDIDDYREVLKNAITAKGEITAKEQRIIELQKEREISQEELTKKNNCYDIFLYNKLSDAEKELDEKRKSLDEAKTHNATLTADIRNLLAQVEAAEKLKTEIEGLKKELEKAQGEKEQWELLTRAFSHNGIQALELDALCPAIAASANNLLSETYGSRFNIEFRTQRESGSGKNMKQIEDFQIFVYDSEEMNTDLQYQNLMTMSGGEKVWIMKALFDAFAYVRENNTGLKYLTIFLDEADGALSPEKKHLYLKMVDAAQRQSGRIHTIIITHDAVIQESAGERIIMNELGKLGEKVA